MIGHYLGNLFSRYLLMLHDDLWWISLKKNWQLVHSVEKTVSPKSATLKSSPKGFETPPISKGYYNVVSETYCLCGIGFELMLAVKSVCHFNTRAVCDDPFYKLMLYFSLLRKIELCVSFSEAVAVWWWNLLNEVCWNDRFMELLSHSCGHFWSEELPRKKELVKQ